MNHLYNQKQINAVNGNVFAWLADRYLDEDTKMDVQEALAPCCERCGAKEIRSQRAHKDGGYVLNLSLTDGLCPACLDEIDGN